ncbi:MAG TPA: inorganic phosphate transporter [Bacteroidales bacterium]|nr:inorganic phosphate transporter [Bacteroidales bacterium]
MTTIVIITIVVAVLYDFLNGMNDAGNSIATIVGTNVLPPKIAVLWAAFFNFVAFGIFYGSPVAHKIGTGIIMPGTLEKDTVFILCSLLGAGSWVLICARNGIPNSVSHALIGGLIGPALIKFGPAAVNVPNVLTIVLFIALAPLFGFIIGYFFMNLTLLIWGKKPPLKTDRYFRVFQLLSSAAFSIGHGGNDAQKTMGIIFMLLLATGDPQYTSNPDHIPFWVALTCYTSIALGTLLGSGRIVKTLGRGLCHLKPIGGFCAETAGALTLFGVTLAGIPVSTTHTITGAIMGVGVTKRASSVKWKLAANIVVAWVLTIPASMFFSALIYYVLKLFL